MKLNLADYRKPYFWIIFSILTLFCYLTALFPSIMEARNFVSIREIIASGDWIHTTLNGEIRYEKPPLPSWIGAVFAYFFGTDNTWALRFPAALATLTMIVYFRKIILYLFRNPELANISAITASSSYLILYVGKSAIWDVYCYSFTLIGIYYFIKALDQNTWKNWLLFGFFAGLSILSKGPLGLVVMMGPMLLSYLFFVDRSMLQKINYPKMLVAAMLMLALGFSWYGYIYITDHEVFMAIVEKESLARINRNVKPWHRYASFVAQNGIWVLPTALAMVSLFFKDQSASPKKLKFFLFWALGSVLILSIPPEKKERYLFPVMFPLALLAGNFIYQALQKRKSWQAQALNWYFFFIGILLFALAIGVFFSPYEIGIKEVLFSLSLLTLSALLVFKALRKELQSAYQFLLLSVLCLLLLGGPVALNIVYQNPKQTPSLQSLKHQKYPDLPLYSLDVYSPELWYSYQDIIPDYKTEQELQQIKEDHFLLLTMQKNEVAFKVADSTFVISKAFEVDENPVAKNTQNYTDRKLLNVWEFKRR